MESWGEALENALRSHPDIGSKCVSKDNINFIPTLNDEWRLDIESPYNDSEYERIADKVATLLKNSNYTHIQFAQIEEIDDGWNRSSSYIYVVNIQPGTLKQGDNLLSN